jgi:F0F1-type ATP synthase membrane subunit b/b'
MPLKTILAALALFSSLALIACGNPEKKDVSTPKGQQNATRDEALQEIDIVRKDLVRATHMLQTGRPKQAEEVVAETYVQHYEKVEKVFGSIDKQLNAKIEEELSGKLRKMIKDGVAAAKVVKYITVVDADLGRAQDKLKE